MNVDLVLAALREAFPGDAISAAAIPMNETLVELSPDRLREAVELLIERFDIRHLSTITGLDTGTEIQLFYHFWHGQGLTLCTALSREGPCIASLIDLVPGAAFYEREVGEMFDVPFEGHAHMLRLLLPDDWDGEGPLRQHEDPAGGEV